jgi:hypothetical protein
MIIFYFSWIRCFNINYSFFRQIELSNNIISLYTVYSLPNGLWILTGLLFLRIILNNEKRMLIIYSIIFIIISIFIEIGQLFNLISGTFDKFDLITIIIFSSIGFIINIYRGKYEKI